MIACFLFYVDMCCNDDGIMYWPLLVFLCVWMLLNFIWWMADIAFGEKRGGVIRKCCKYEWINSTNFKSDGDLVLRRSSRLNQSTTEFTLGISIWPSHMCPIYHWHMHTPHVPNLPLAYAHTSCALGREGAQRVYGKREDTWEDRGHMGG